MDTDESQRVMQHLIVGDIHGCFDELQDLLQAAGLAPDDQIIALGDIVDRGRIPRGCWSSSTRQTTRCR